MTTYELLIKKFDKISLLTLSSRPERLKAVKEQLMYIGETPENSSVCIQKATLFPYNNIIISAFNASGRGRFTKPNEYDCARNHYSIVKQAYEEGVEHLLVIEDDIMILKDQEKLQSLIMSIPDDYDVLQFGAFTTDPKVRKYLNKKELWQKHPDVGLWNASMYALSRKGMEYYIAFMDKFFWVADGPLYKAQLNYKIINAYVSTFPAVIQADKNIVSSDIRNSSNDTIDYSNDNIYEENMSESDYFDYSL